MAGPERTPVPRAAVVAELSRHQVRRDRGTPTVSVLVGPCAQGVSAWRDWAAAYERAGLVRNAHDPALAESLLQWAFDRESVWARARHEAARRVGVSLDELMRRASVGTVRENELLLRRVRLRGGSPLDRLVALAARHPGTTVPASLRALSEDPWAFFTSVAEAWIDRPHLPALLLQAPQDDLDRAARILGDLAAALPQMPVALALDATVYDAYLASAPESRYKALLRETPLRLEPAAPPVHAGRAAESLRAAGAGQAVVEAYRSLVSKAPTGAALDDGARSEAERFFHILLDGLPRTAGLFELNGRLDVPFGGRPCMEVDFLCRRHGLAVELDGYHHFQDPARYRTDRTKDYLLQRHGYLVLRFLAEDVVSDLESILARLLEALDSRDRPAT